MTGVRELSLSRFTTGDAEAQEGFSCDLFASLKEHGFVVLKDHGVPPQVLARAYALAQQLFALPDSIKRRYAAGMRGYTPFGVEHAKDHAPADLKEFWQIGHEPAGNPAADEAFPANVWPEAPAAFREVFLDLFAQLNETGLILLRALAPRLGLPHAHFEPLARRGTSILRVLHYPPLAAGMDPKALRSAPHEDINLLTLMVAAEGPGLQILDREGRWLGVEAQPEALIVNCGDMLARMTNGVLPATTHRVVNPQGPGASRYSMPFFMHPTLQTSLKVLPSCLGDGARFDDITAGQFLHERLRAIGMA